jgi:hypothetical protein
METTIVLTEMALIVVAISVSWISVRVFGTPAIQAAYDLGREAQLEQAIEWLKNCNMDHSLSYDGEYRSDRYLVVNAFREAMRPTTTTTTQEDNNDT